MSTNLISLLHRSRGWSVAPLLAAGVGLICGFAHADRIILTPAPTALLQDTYRAEAMQQLGANSQSDVWLQAGTEYAEAEVSEFHRRDRDAAALSLTTQILPETEGLPAIAVGVRDITDATSRYGGIGYRGRSFYFSAGRTPTQFAASPYPIRNLSYTFGLGEGGIQGPFGSVSGDLPFKLRWTAEWDSYMFNEKLSLPLSTMSQLNILRIGKSTLIGLEYHTPLTTF